MLSAQTFSLVCLRFCHHFVRFDHCVFVRCPLVFVLPLSYCLDARTALISPRHAFAVTARLSSAAHAPLPLLLRLFRCSSVLHGLYVCCFAAHCSSSLQVVDVHSRSHVDQISSPRARGSCSARSTPTADAAVHNIARRMVFFCCIAYACILVLCLPSLQVAHARIATVSHAPARPMHMAIGCCARGCQCTRTCGGEAGGCIWS